MSDSIVVSCVGCDKRYKAKPTDIGKSMKCACGEIIIIREGPPQLSNLLNVNVSKARFRDQISIEGDCPNCGEALKLKENEIHVGQDTCPSCDQLFAIGEINIEAAMKMRNEIAVVKSKERQRTQKSEAQHEAIQQANRYAKKKCEIKNEDEPLLDIEKNKTQTGDQQKFDGSLLHLSLEVKKSGITKTEKLFPNVPRALNLMQVLTFAASFLWGLGVAILFIAGCVQITENNESLGMQWIFTSFGLALLLAIFYIFSMAGIELYKILISIESQNRITNALQSMQIDLLEKLNQPDDEV